MFPEKEDGEEKLITENLNPSGDAKAWTWELDVQWTRYSNELASGNMSYVMYYTIDFVMCK